MDPFKRKHILTVLCTKLTCSVKVGEGEKEICSSFKKCCYLSHWESFWFNRAGPKQVKRIRCNLPAPKLEASSALGVWKRKILLLENENQYMKPGMSCLWGTKFEAQNPSPSHLVQQQQLKAGKSSLLPHSPILLGMSRPSCIMKRNNF